MRQFLFALFLAPLFCHAQEPATSPATSPDWKALYTQANTATKAWKDRAQSLEAENAELKDRVALLTSKLADDPARAAADEKRRQQLLAIERARTAPPVIIQGKVLSVTQSGILVSCEEASAATPDKLCFIEVDNPGSYLDGQGVNLRVATMPEPYRYTAANGAGRRVPRFYPLPQ